MVFPNCVACRDLEKTLLLKKVGEWRFVSLLLLLWCVPLKIAVSFGLRCFRHNPSIGYSVALCVVGV